MKAIEILFWLFFGSMIGAALILSFASWLRKIRKQEDQYERLHDRIQRDMRLREPYADVRIMFDQLHGLPWKNPEKTKVLYEQIMNQYGKEAKDERTKFIKDSLMRHIEKRKIVKV